MLNGKPVRSGQFDCYSGSARKAFVLVREVFSSEAPKSSCELFDSSSFEDEPSMVAGVNQEGMALDVMRRSRSYLFLFGNK